MKHPVEKILDFAVSDIAGRMVLMWDHLPCESEIERIFAMAFIVAGEFQKNRFRRTGIIVGAVDSVEKDTMSVYALPQFHFENFRLDFLIIAFNGSDWERLVVECDGHDFHERTKEQAAKDRARDRKIQESGMPIYRFTGSELYRDPVACAQQVIKWADGVVSKHASVSEGGS